MLPMQAQPQQQQHQQDEDLMEQDEPALHGGVHGPAGQPGVQQPQVSFLAIAGCTLSMHARLAEQIPSKVQPD
jgi:hypothetical protein